MTPRSLFLLWLGLTVPSAAWAQTAPPAPLARAGLEYKFETQAGKVYVVEGLRDGATWVQVSPPVFGDGKENAARFSVDSADGQRRYSQYRAREVDPALYGPAPVSLEGQTLLLNDNGRERQIILYKESLGTFRGVLKTDATHARSFTYKAIRTGQDSFRLELTYFDNTTAVASLRFFDAALGSYQFREFDLQGNVQGLEAGGFGLHSTRPPGNADTSLPATLAGTSQLFTQGGRGTRLEFLSPDEVIVHQEDGSQETRAYDYDLNSPAKGTLRIALPSGSTLVYDLSLTAGGSGVFSQTMEPPPGQLPTPANSSSNPTHGGFDLPPSPPPAPQKPDCPPKSLDGKSIVLSNSDPVTLYFQADGTGTAVRERGGSVEVTPFSYDYSRNGSASASLSIIFPGANSDKVDDYDLDFNPDCTGTYQTSSFNNGESNLVSNGGFSTGGGIAGNP